MPSCIKLKFLNFDIFKALYISGLVTFVKSAEKLILVNNLIQNPKSEYNQNPSTKLSHTDYYCTRILSNLRLR